MTDEHEDWIGLTYGQWREIQECPIDPGLDPQITAQLRLETGWSPLEPRPLLTQLEDRTMAEKVGSGLLACPLCKGRNRVYLPHIGQLTGLKILYAQDCNCIVARLFFDRWLNTANVPPKFRHVRLAELTTYTGNHCPCPPELQKRAISTFQRHPEGSYLITGPPGAGKTMYSVALLRAAYQRWTTACFLNSRVIEAVWRVSATQLLQQMQDWNVDRKDDTVEPTVTKEKILRAKKHNFVPSLFIDELDKFRPTETRVSNLLEIVNAVYEADGQLVGTSNLSLDELLLTKQAVEGSGDALSIFRRFVERPKGRNVHSGRPSFWKDSSGIGAGKSISFECFSDS